MFLGQHQENRSMDRILFWGSLLLLIGASPLHA
ncbi:hypothetical protein WL1483_1996 [Aeromonas schubertii]|uniref:Uncharacterized protein n=1 Tax=Aeromonas schubertii TaxID=652 RepID=A0A0S2SI91_9GAMM|nr:hypothetical protein WL1483_1996 [Aeromonas schubertii]